MHITLPTEAAEAPVISVYRCQSARYLYISFLHTAQMQRFYYLRMETLSPKRRYFISSTDGGESSE